MKFIAIITRSLKKPKMGWDTEELKSIQFEARSITAGKTRATKMTNAQVLLEKVVQSDDTIRDITGADLRWKNWDIRDLYVQDNGKRVGWSGKRSENFYGNFDVATGTFPKYFVWVTLHWVR